MFSDKPNIQILTSLLIEHHIKHAVVCPGSRNAPIVHNLCQCGQINCIPVTDERSAGFCALGMALKSGQPVAVCVTSGSALLNLLPAVAEAYYQHIPLLVISADRPRQWIDQLDGQTMPQQNVLSQFAGDAVSLPEPRDEEEQWYCNRLVNQALNQLYQHGGAPVHINVPVSEPLYMFNASTLETNQRIIHVHHNFTADLSPLFNRMQTAKRPMIVIGQTADYKHLIDFKPDNIVVLHEALSVGALPFEKILAVNTAADRLMPDFILYLGGSVVSKRLKTFLRSVKQACCWHVNDDGLIYDTFQCLEGVVVCPLPQCLRQLNLFFNSNSGHFDNEFADLWKKELQKAEEATLCYQPPFSSMMAVKMLEQSLHDKRCYTHYANSSPIRLANIYARHHVWCNRGLNGIEGTLSTAAGFSLIADNPVFCVIGDLSFFYDQNALWNQQLKGNLRILLLNNGGGAIFEGLKGARQSPVFHTAIAAAHHTSAEGICRQNNIGYQAATDEDSLKNGIEWLTSNTAQSQRPLLLEIFTSSEADNQALSNYW